jgi:cell wall-associated NlpC family hydrolase
MFHGIEKFQKDHGLKVDQVVNPGGPTENALNQALAHPSLRNGGRYDPNQPRDWRGRWTSSGGGGGRKSLLHMAADSGSTANERDISARDKEKVLEAADDWLGTPYAPRNTLLAGGQAKKKEGGDCSGSTNRIFDEAGLGYKYTESTKFSEAVKNGKIPFRKVEADEIQPTDVVVFEGVGHMAIYAGNGNVYSARRTGDNPYGVYPMQWFGANRSYYRYQK